MSHAFAAHFGLCDFNAAFVANHAAMLHAFVFAAQTFPVRDRAKDARAEQAIAFGLESTIVDRFRLGHMTMRPGTDFFR
jgi:hypothetical protein